MSLPSERLINDVGLPDEGCHIETALPHPESFQDGINLSKITRDDWGRLGKIISEESVNLFDSTLDMAIVVGGGKGNARHIARALMDLHEGNIDSSLGTASRALITLLPGIERALDWPTGRCKSILTAPVVTPDQAKYPAYMSPEDIDPDDLWDSVPAARPGEEPEPEPLHPDDIDPRDLWSAPTVVQAPTDIPDDDSDVRITVGQAVEDLAALAEHTDPEPEPDAVSDLRARLTDLAESYIKALDGIGGLSEATQDSSDKARKVVARAFCEAIEAVAKPQPKKSKVHVGRSYYPAMWSAPLWPSYSSLPLTYMSSTEGTTEP